MSFKNAIAILSIMLGVLISCGSPNEKQSDEKSEETAGAGEVNIYSHRHYDSDKELFKLFTEKTGIKVNVIKASADELMNKMEVEGENSPADVLLTVDAGRLYRAKAKDLLKPVSSETLEANIPAQFRDSDNKWFGLTYRARIIVYDKKKVTPDDLTTYEDLTTEKWNGKVLIRSSGNIYNQSLLASIIENSGRDAAKAWAAGVVGNMAREPKGNDRDQVKAIVEGLGEVAVVNTYYIGLLLNSENAEEVKAGEAVGIFFPNQDDRGAHVNVSGAGVAKYAPNEANAVKFLEFLSSEEAQKVFASVNYEYPVNASVEPAELLKSWGEFKIDQVDLNALGANNKEAVLVFDEVGWK
ncbi:MAG: Fe(3+) ABC transporter substrate-binding protein [Bacteroidota bacterium]